MMGGVSRGGKGSGSGRSGASGASGAGSGAGPGVRGGGGRGGGGGGGGVPQRRSEVAEVKAQLKNITPSQLSQKREVFRRVIGYMTLGLDVSELLMDMILATSTRDVVLKKMLYLYLVTYASSHPELALLCINTLVKDCAEQDPTIRGLALRSLCSLRCDNVTEYMLPQIHRGLEDANAYVRRCAVMCVLKLHQFAPASVETDGLAGAGASEAASASVYLMQLESMLATDPDASVRAACLNVLEDVYREVNGSGLPVRRETVMALLGRLKEYNEWAQCSVLRYVGRYKPKSETEVYEVMNVLDDRLNHSNSAVVLGATRVFLSLTADLPDLQVQVAGRLRSPLLTLVGQGGECGWSVLCHLALLVRRCPALYAADYRPFFCRHNDSRHVKVLKLGILVSIADCECAGEVVQELSQYVTEVDERFARDAVQAIAAIAAKGSSKPGPDVINADPIVDRLLAFLETGTLHIASEVVVALKDLVRRFPHRAADVVEAICYVPMDALHDPAARAAFVWILGAFGELPAGEGKDPSTPLRPVPYILEGLAEGFADEPVAVRAALLTAVLHNFLHAPAEYRPALQLCLEAGLNDEHQDVHDRALLYCRALQQGAAGDEDLGALARRLVGSAGGSHVSYFMHPRSEAAEERVYAEFNTLAVPYQTPSSVLFHGKEGDLDGMWDVAEGDERGARSDGIAHGLLGGETSPASGQADAAGQADAGDRSQSPHPLGASAEPYSAPNLIDLLSMDIDPVPAQPAPQTRAVGPAAASPASDQGADLDLLGLFGDDGGGGGGGGGGDGSNGFGASGGLGDGAPPRATTGDVSRMSPVAFGPSGLMLDPGSKMDPDEYQQQWDRAASGRATERDLAEEEVYLLIEADDVIRRVEARGAHCIASGPRDNATCFFFYGRAVGERGFFLAEAQISASGHLRVEARQVERGGGAGSPLAFAEALVHVILNHSAS